MRKFLCIGIVTTTMAWRRHCRSVILIVYRRLGRRDGYGCFTWGSGDRYIGEFADDKPHGPHTSRAVMAACRLFPLPRRPRAQLREGVSARGDAATRVQASEAQIAHHIP